MSDNPILTNWRYDGEHGWVEAADGKVVLFMPFDQRDITANNGLASKIGNLAAAAPKMLTALEHARPTIANALAEANVGSWIRDTREKILTHVDAAIKLARGEK